jgi:hypothetical protein
LVLHSYGVVAIPSHRGYPVDAATTPHNALSNTHNSINFYPIDTKVAINEAGSALVVVVPSTVGNDKNSK